MSRKFTDDELYMMLTDMVFRVEADDSLDVGQLTDRYETIKKLEAILDDVAEEHRVREYGES